MYNLISFNNLKDIVVNQNNFDETNELDKVSEYFECITECDVNDSSCRSYCRQVLDWVKPNNKVGSSTLPFYSVFDIY